MYRSLRVQQFRSYKDYTVDFSPGVTIIVGPNGSGKTNLLEALYVLSAGGSFRGIDRDLLRRGNDWFRLEALYGEQQRVLTYRFGPSQPEKLFLLDGVRKARLLHAQRAPVVLFEPDHLRLLKDAPSLRRDYLDTLLSTLHPDYAWLKHQFERVLAQRNNLLKRRFAPDKRDDLLFVWDVKFAEYAKRIVDYRQELVGVINNRLNDRYAAIAKQKHRLRAEYVSTIPTENYQAAALQLLQANIGRDSERGFTGLGPHRDDMMVIFDGAAANSVASRGEMRSLLLAIKIIELDLLAEHFEQTPLLLLDDVFSELDTQRRRALADLTKAYQTIITTTDADVVTHHFADAGSIIPLERGA